MTEMKDKQISGCQGLGDVGKVQGMDVSVKG